jgi:hypothetical protein
MTTDQIAITSLAISVASVLVSLYVAWWTLWRRGSIKMTRPSMIALVHKNSRPMVWLRTMLYSTGKQGYVLESVFVKVRRGESMQTFSHWRYRQEEQIVVGSGLKIDEAGVSYDHYFYLPRGVGSGFQFLAGSYEILVYAVLNSPCEPICLGTYSVILSEENSKKLHEGKSAVAAVFEWGPDSQKYHIELDVQNDRGPVELALRVSEVRSDSG